MAIVFQAVLATAGLAGDFSMAEAVGALMVLSAGTGSAFWGVLAGALTLFVQQYGQAKTSPN